MTGLTASLTCLQCGEPVEVVNIGRVLAGREVSAVVRCAARLCQREWHLCVTLGPLNGKELRGNGPPRNAAECGTDSGYRAHLKHGTEKCEPCKDAHRAAVRKWANTNRQSRAKVAV